MSPRTEQADAILRAVQLLSDQLDALRREAAQCGFRNTAAALDRADDELGTAFELILVRS